MHTDIIRIWSKELRDQNSHVSLQDDYNSFVTNSNIRVKDVIQSVVNGDEHNFPKLILTVRYDVIAR